MTSRAPTDVAAAADAALVGQVVDFVRWVGDGRKLTQKGAITLADARVLVDRLGTGDKIDPVIGEQVFKTKSSVELLGLGLIVEWATAARLVRVVRGRLVPVKKAAALLERPAELWMALFESFGGRLGTAFLPAGWGESFMRREFAAGAGALLSALHGRDGVVGLEELCDRAWDAVTARYVLDDATDVQLDTARRMNDRDVRRTLAALVRLGAVTLTENSAELTAIGRCGTRRMRGEPELGDPVHRITVTLAEVTEPPVWRRLLIPAALPLNRLHDVIQMAMGWQDHHLHSFTDGSRTYGLPDLELGLIDERSVRFGDLDVAGGRIGYTYDFGDGWEHEIVVETVGVAEPGECYPRCIGGEGACPPEDCGGPPGYQRLREILADPGDEEHDDMLRWLGLDHACEFDPAAFDMEAVNRGLVAIGAPQWR